MRQLKLTAEFTHEEKDLSFMVARFSEFRADLLRLGFRTKVHWFEDREVSEAVVATDALIFFEPATLVEILPREVLASSLSVDFGSSEAAELADKANLTDADFKGVKPSGKKGFTVGDVRKIIG